MATSGIESMLAVAMPVTRLVAPGPLVAMQTPTLPVAVRNRPRRARALLVAGQDMPDAGVEQHVVVGMIWPPG